MQLILRIGNFVTGTNLEEEDVVSATTKQLGDGRDYYLYEVRVGAILGTLEWWAGGSSMKWRLRSWGSAVASACTRCACQWGPAGRLQQQQGSPRSAAASPSLGLCPIDSSKAAVQHRQHRQQYTFSRIVRLPARAGVCALQQDRGAQPGGLHNQGALALWWQALVACGARQCALMQGHVAMCIGPPPNSWPVCCLLPLLLQGPLAYLFVLTANEKQWGAAEGKLRTMLETFRA